VILREIFAALAWLIAVIWIVRVLPALFLLPSVPDLLRDQPAPDVPATELPSLAVVVPAKDEVRAVGRSVATILASDYPALQTIVVDDRSTDGTGELLDAIAAEPTAAGRLKVLHVRELPEGWIGKPHAMAQAAAMSASEWILFTDADVRFAPDTLRRAVRFAEQTKGDHLVVYPTLELHGWAEKMLGAFFQCASVLGGQPWKIPDPRAQRAYIGVGAFNLIRRSTYDALGGFSTLRMEVLEDMRLGFLVKRNGFAQRVAFGRDLVRIRWADSAAGMLRNLTKNLFAVFRFRPLNLVLASLALLLLCIVPFVTFVMPGITRWAGILPLLFLLLINTYYRRYTGTSPLYFFLLPVASVLLAGTMLTSAFVAIRRGGVLWRGTLYPLDELRRRAGALW
jgi:cellulose synthase/poly-beta-1,6-N-acetylglucosamine synthase-like glycosyltransferase